VLYEWYHRINQAISEVFAEELLLTRTFSLFWSVAGIAQTNLNVKVLQAHKNQSTMHEDKSEQVRKKIDIYTKYVIGGI